MRRNVERNGKVDVLMVGVESEMSGEKLLRALTFILRDSKGPPYILECMISSMGAI